MHHLEEAQEKNDTNVERKLHHKLLWLGWKVSNVGHIFLTHVRIYRSHVQRSYG